MPECGLHYGVNWYNAAMSPCSEGEQEEQVLELLDDVRKSAQSRRCLVHCKILGLRCMADDGDFVSAFRRDLTR